MTGNLKYQAYQTAYIAAGFIVQLWLVTIVLLLFAWLVILPFIVPIDFIKKFIIEKLIGVAPSLGYLIFIIGKELKIASTFVIFTRPLSFSPFTVLQNILCRFIIMQDSNINTAIDNRRVYNLVAYFFFLNVSILLYLDASILF